MKAQKKVMLLKEIKTKEELKPYFKDKDWIAEFKRDGNRLFLDLSKYENGDLLYTFNNRKGKPYSKDIPELIAESVMLFNEDDYMTSCVLDGELVYVDDTGHDHRTQAQCKTATPYFMIFDILSLNGEDLTDRTWAERKHELFELCRVYDLQPMSDNNIVFMPHYTDKKAVLKTAEENNMEGIVLKNVKGKYVDGRSKDCLKYKFTLTDDYIVIGFTEASEFSINTKGETIKNKRFPYFRALILASKDGDKYICRGQVGGGFSDINVKKVTKLLKKNKKLNQITGHGLVDKDYRQSKGKIQWLDEEDFFIIEIKYAELSEYGIPFQPRFLHLRLDK